MRTYQSRILPPFAAVFGFLLTSCASHVTTHETYPLLADADAPYDKILVISLFDTFDPRRYLEDEIVKALEEDNIEAVASTSMMDSRTPLVRQTFVDMIDKTGADAILVTQLTAHAADTTERDASPEVSWNYWPTYYWNVFQVEMVEYVEPPRLETDHELILASQVFSVSMEKPVWGMESTSEFTVVQEDGLDYQIFIDEAEAIVSRLRRSDIIKP